MKDKNQIDSAEYISLEEAKRIKLPFYDGLAAGFPSPAMDYQHESLDLNEKFVSHPEASYFVRVRGESMIGLGILDGDICLVDRQEEIYNGNIVVADGINAKLNSGQLTCLLGANGAGKSTLLRTLSAFQPALAGSITYDGRKLDDFTPQERARLIGVVLTERSKMEYMNVRDLVSMGRMPYTGFWGGMNDDDREIVNEAMEKVGITALADRMVDTLSDGERQKVMIAKALAQQTPVIYLDEPTAFLDFPSKVETMQLLLTLCHDMQKTVFLSTHDVEIAIQMADSCWVMGDGGLHIGTPRELAEQGIISRFVERPGVVFDKENLSIRIN